MGAQHGRFRILRIEFAHQSMPEKSGRPQHGNVHEKVHADAEKERESRGKGVDIHTAFQGCPDILNAVSQGKGGLQHTVGTGFHHMVAADADGVVLRHILWNRRP